MGILSYINEKKGQFKEKQEAYLNQRAMKAEKEAARMNNERLKTETRLESQRSYAKEKALLSAARQEEFNNSTTGKLFGAVKTRLAENKVKQRNTKAKATSTGFGGFQSTGGFGLGQPSNKSVFGASFGEQKNAPTIKKKKENKGVTIIVRR